ncbi:Glycoside hydrolase family 61 [Macrophomina phaseolina MS6]|uniref:AA9 family lytic polysaccharide monooxygenase n=1 Tax=Macrophomina phaseolina (strain MS6) TaxID=1126212 RepID=K2RDY2_MACPH|nr:Glycoside hydrolase family 61 [Macrophomina phaseolina MS6]
MKTFATFALAASVLAQTVSGHYIFEYLTANGVKGGAYQNIRQNTNNNSPVTDLASNDLRCNVGGADGSKTSTVSVAAGSSVSFTADIAVYHQGPTSFYMTKVADASKADGSTPWFKIKDIGPTVSHIQDP